jgi:CHAT domain-containing protein
MNVRHYFSLLVFCFTFLFFGLSVGVAQNWEKEFGKADALYNQAKYSQANKQLTKLKAKLIKKLGSENTYMPHLYIREANFNLRSGVLVGIDESLDKAISVSYSKNGENSAAHAEVQINVAEVYANYGNYHKARQQIEAARGTLEASGQGDDDLKAKLELTMAKIYTGQGFYTQALEFIDGQFDYFNSRAVKKETYIDEGSGKLKTRKLSEEEVIRRLGDYATLLTLKANTYRKMGNITEADVAFLGAEKWIFRNMGATSEYYAMNQYLFGQMWVENGLLTFKDEDVKNLRFDKTLSQLKKNYNESHFLAFDLYEAMLKMYLREGNNSKYRNVKFEYEKAIKKNFDKKNSIHYVNLQTVEFDAKLDKEKTKDLESKAIAILVNNQAMPKYHQKRIDLLEFLHVLALGNRSYGNAEAYLAQIVEIKKVLYGELSPEYHLGLIQLANFYIDYTDKLAASKAIYTKSFYEIVDKEVNFWHVDYLNTLTHIARMHELLDDYPAAKRVSNEAGAAARGKYRDDDPEFAVQLEQLASLSIKLGEYESAEENLKKAITIFASKTRDKAYSGYLTNYSKALETQASLLAIKGMYDDSESTLAQSTKVVSKAPSRLDINELSSAEQLSSLYIFLGKYNPAEEKIREIIPEYTRLYGANSGRLIDPLVNQGRMRLIVGDYTEAERIARRVNTIAVSVYGDQSTKTSRTLILLAEIYYTIGDYERAETLLNQAITIDKSRYGMDHIDVAKSISQLALVKFNKGDNLKEVEGLMNQAKGIIEKKLGTRNPRYAEILENLAVVYISQKRWDDAFNALGLAEAIWVAKVGKKNNIKAAGIYILTGDVYYHQRDYKRAKSNYDQAKRLYEKNFNKNHPEYVKVLSKLSKVYFMEKDTKNARATIEEALANYANFIKAYFPALSEREKTKYWNTIKSDFEFYNTLAASQADREPAMVATMMNNALLTKAILLNSSIKIRERILNSSDEQLKNSFLLWMEKKEFLTNALSMSIDQLLENQIDLVGLTNEVENLEKELSRKSELFGQSFEEKAITWENVRNVLKGNEVAVEMIRYRHFDHVFTDSVVYALAYVKNDKSQPRPKLVLLPNGSELEGRYLRNYKNSIVYRVTDRFSYEKYWKPIEKGIGGLNTIYLSADGVYNQINLEAIPTGDGKYVLDNSNIILVSNTKDIYLRKVKTQRIQTEKRATMFGNPEFYLTASAATIVNPVLPLPETDQEIKILRELLKSKGWTADTYVENLATEERIKLMDNPRVFHVATHGFYAPQEEAKVDDTFGFSNTAYEQNPLLKTGLLLSGAGDLLDKSPYNFNIDNGILTAYEAMNLNLDLTELVVLSACETGVGELTAGEGVYGLQRAFMVAGAKTLIMSIFKVDDLATQKLMTTFYRKWIETGNKRQSFIDAKKEVRIEFEDPFYWGAFIMIGLD